MGKSKLVFCFFSFFISTLLIYLPTRHSKFVFDFIDLASGFEEKGIQALAESSGLSPYFISRTCFYIFWKSFHYNEVLWFVSMCLLHAVNVFLVYRICNKGVEIFNYKAPHYFCIVSALVFLISPYHTEVIVWGGALTYLIVSFFVLSGFLTFLKYITEDRKIYLLVSLILFSFGVLSHESGLFIFPGLLFFLLLPVKQNNLIRRRIAYFGVGIAVIIILYFFNQIARGGLIGHYGASTHLHFEAGKMVSTYFMYLIKILLASPLFPATQGKIFSQLSATPKVFLISTVFLLTALVFLSFRKRNITFPGLMFICFTFLIFPVLNLYFPYWINIQADRYCYLPSAFLLPAVVLGLCLLPVWFREFFFAVWLSAFSVLLFQNIHSWKNAGRLISNLKKDFRWGSSNRVFILNLPDNFRGAYIFRSFTPSYFLSSFLTNPENRPTAEIQEVLSYNLNSITDSVFVEKIDSNSLRVVLSAPENWWWREKQGATSYENELVKVTIDEWNHSYVALFKQRQPDDVFIYHVLGSWKEVREF